MEEKSTPHQKKGEEVEKKTPDLKIEVVDKAPEPTGHKVAEKKVHKKEAKEHTATSHNHKTEPKKKEVKEALTEEKAQSSEEAEKAESKTLFIAIAGLIAFFAIVFIAFQIYDSVAEEKIYTVDELHQLNLEGKLDSEEGYLYNGFSFVLHDGLWWTDIIKTFEDESQQMVRIPLHYGPRDLENIQVSGELDDGFGVGNNLYIGIDPTTVNSYYTLAISELSINAARVINRNPTGSCTFDEPSVCVDRPIVSCDNNPQDLPTVELAMSSTPGDPEIIYSGTCIKLVGNEEGIVQATDYLLWNWYGII